MFSNIPELLPVIVLATVFVVSLIGVIQYSRYEAHRKAHIEDPEGSDSYRLATKFSAVPYLIVPVCFGAVSILSALFLTDILAGREYIHAGEINYVAVAASIILYLITDKLVVRQCGNAVYFDTIEDKLFQRTAAVVAEKNLTPRTGDIITISREEYERIMKK